MSPENNSKKSKPSVLDQWKKRKKKATAPQGIPQKPADVAAIPSHGQQRLWVLQQLYPENSFYQYAHLYKISGKLDQETLTQSFQLLCNQHEILRTNFVKKEALLLTIKPEITFTIDLFEGKETRKENIALAQKIATKTFDLAKDLLIRADLIRIDEQKHWIVLSMHHIIGDQLSLRRIQTDLFTFYQNIVDGKEQALTKQTFNYSDFAWWQRSQKTKPADEQYWLKQLAGDLPLLNFPSALPRPIKASFQGKTLREILPADLSQQLQTLAKSHNTTLYVFILAAFKALLYRNTGQTDILVGTPFSNRDKVVLENLIGFFNETVVIRSTLADELPFSQLIGEIKETTLEAFQHKNIPFDQVVNALQPERHKNANPVFQVMYLYTKIEDNVIKYPDFEIEEEVVDLQVSKFDLTLFVTDKKEGLELGFEYSTDLFIASTIEDLSSQLSVMLQALSQNTETTIAQLPLLSKATTQKIVVDWNATDVALPQYASIHQMVGEMAKKYPNNTAVAFHEDTLTYNELDQQANAIAQILQTVGVKPNTPVGLYIDRSVGMIAGMLGILKAGAAYLPLDPKYPLERNAFLLEDSGATAVLTTKSLADKLDFNNIEVVFIETALQNATTATIALPETKPTDLAYIIYTSGSSGKPKGVVISHANLLHSTQARFAFYPENPESFLLLSSFSFDSSVAGIFWTLCTGGKLVLAPKRIEQDMEMLSGLIAKEEITHTLLLPSLYALVLKFSAKKQLKTLKNVMVAGEACPLTLVDKHYEQLPHTLLYNEYGPTEASVWCIAHQIQPNEKYMVPIGKAIPNTQVYILDKYLQPVPLGAIGELYIGGPGLSDGYLNRPDLTAEKFIPHPFAENKKIYKTGDLGAFLPDGNIKFLGRADFQVKIRGFRVELDEIQKVILQEDSIQESVVMVYATTNEEGDTTQQLIAYISQISDEAILSLQQELRSKLPPYMVPAQIIPLAEFPHLPNGKINRKALPKPDVNVKLTTTNDFVAAQNATEEKLVHIWESILKKTPIGTNDNFFAIGGDSILSIQMVSKAKDVNIRLAPHQLFEHQTIAELAKSTLSQVISTEAKEEKPVIPIKNPTEYPLSYLQNAFLFNSLSDTFDQGKLLLEFTIEGEIDVALFKAAWQKSVEQHDAMRAFIDTKDGKSIQVIAPEATLTWEILDYQKLDFTAKENVLAVAKEKLAAESVDLYTAPISKMQLLHLGKQKQVLLWSCHHVFLDGWSCGIILKDALTFYETLSQNKAPIINLLPNFPAFLDWQKNSDTSESETFWKEELDEIDTSLNFQLEESGNIGQEKFRDETLHLSKEVTEKLHLFCQENKLTLPTLCQGLWAVLLSNYFDTRDVLYGLTVSGRFADFQDIASVSGLFMDVVPNRFILPKEQHFSDWLRAIQKHQGKIAMHEGSSLEKIKAWINHEGNAELFDSLFVFGNFLKDGLTVGDLRISHFEGGFSSSYPLTVRVNPVASLELNFRHNAELLSAKQIHWFKDAFSFLVKIIAKNELKSIKMGALQQKLAKNHPSPKTIPTKKIAAATQQLTFKSTSISESYVEPTSLLESQLCSIWQNIFTGISVGIDHNFFALGGNSLMALDLFSALEKTFDYRLAPSVLFNAPTVKTLALLIENQQTKTKETPTLVPLRATGDKTPIFCVHGGGAHVFFYQAFATCLPDDQPIYSLQPKGLDGDGAFHQSIEEMATYYTEEIQGVQKEGPYYLLGTCFSNPVVLEMAEQLKAKGHEIGELFIIDSAPVHLFGNASDGKSRTFQRFVDMLKRGDFGRIQEKIKRRLGKAKQEKVVDLHTESESEKNLRLTIDSLNTLYANYSYTPFDGEVQFIRSSEFNDRNDKKYHLTQWKHLAQGGLDVHIVPGYHESLFEYPAVKGLAEKVNQCLNTHQK